MAVAATQIIVKAVGAASSDELHAPEVSGYMESDVFSSDTAMGGTVEAGQSMILTVGILDDGDMLCVSNTDDSGTGVYNVDDITVGYTDVTTLTANVVTIRPGGVAVLPDVDASANITIASATAKATGKWYVLGV